MIEKLCRQCRNFVPHPSGNDLLGRCRKVVQLLRYDDTHAQHPLASHERQYNGICKPCGLHFEDSSQYPVALRVPDDIIVTRH
jgi:hypothetical protein